jgi:pSer/pThr/pTyr-binding forkhead associated (FHA) protein
MYTVQVVLKALTAEMDLAFRGPILEILEFPFRIGRESRERQPIRPLPPGVVDRRTGASPRNNDLYIIETGSRLFVSRQHLMMEQREHGIYLVDLFSSCGTIVEGKYLGSDHKGGEIQLEHNDVVIVGTSNSPYVFKVMMV